MLDEKNMYKYIYKYATIIVFLLAISNMIKNFSTFFKYIDTLNSPEEWRFYFSLAGFVISIALFMLLLIAMIVKRVIEKKYGIDIFENRKSKL